MRRDFQLPEEDEEFLNTLSFKVETLNDQGMQWLIIRDYPLPQGYTLTEVDVAFKIESGYPRMPLDMAYFHPPIVRKDNKAIGAISLQVIEGKGYQRWSRHRTSLNPWRVGIDDVSTHLALVSNWFLQEFLKKENAFTT
jgi:hypothetical protein